MILPFGAKSANYNYYKKKGEMTTTEKALLICFIGLAFSMTLIAIDAYRLGKERGIREGWHRGRALSRQEFWEE